MSLLPTAHAGQAYGVRKIDFFTVSGQVTQADGSSARLRDDDGIDHHIRLLERTENLSIGDNATMLRVQAGPKRRSRPAAIVNHSRASWMRAAPDATTLLARLGVTRGINWWLAVIVLALTALASVWPLLHAFMVEMNGSMMAGIPGHSVLGELGAAAPALVGWRLEDALPAGLVDAIASLGLVPVDRLTEWGIGIAGAGLALVTYLARSWRLVYVPLYAGFAVMAGTMLGGPEATLFLVGGAVALFLAGGLINRVRDAGRFNARVERLAEHVLRNPPQESVRPADSATAAVAAGAATGLAGEAEEAENAAAPGDDAANGEAEAGPELELPPATAIAAAAVATAETTTRPDNAGEAVAADAGEDVPDEETAAADAEPQPVAGDEAGEDAPDVMAAPDDTETVDDTAEAVEAADPAPEADAGGDTSVAADDGASPADAAEAADEDDDLPSLDAVAAAAALTAAEAAAGTEEAGETGDAEDADTPAGHEPAGMAEDERTLPLAPPPPMPAAGEPPLAADDAAGEGDAETEEVAAAASGRDAAEPDSAGIGASTEDAPAPDAPARSPALTEVENRVAAAVEAAGTAPEGASPVDDPLLDDEVDPMLPANEAGDIAPGAPELDIEPEDAETPVS